MLNHKFPNNFSKNINLIDFLYIFFTALFFSLNIFLGYSKPIWFDESMTIFDLRLDFLLVLIQGTEPHPPFYFIILYFINTFFGEKLILFRVFSTLCSIGGIIILLYYLRNKFSKNSLLPYLLFISTNSYFSYYLCSEIRMYGLFFLLNVIFLVSFDKCIADSQKRNTILLFITATLLLFTHYFGVYYVLILFAFLFFNRKIILRKKGAIFIVFLISITILLLFWTKVFLNQLSVSKGYVWQDNPNIMTIFNFIQYYFGKWGFIIVILIIAVSYYYRFIKYSKFNLKGFYSPGISISIVAYMSVPVIVFILSSINLSVFSERYFTPTFIAISLLLLLLFEKSFFFHKVYYKYVFLILFIGIGFVRISNNYGHIKVMETENKRLLTFLDSGKVVVENPHLYFPLNYYCEISKRNNLYLLLDSISSFHFGSIKNSKVDYLYLKKFEKLNNDIYSLNYNQLRNEFKDFYFIRDSTRRFYETWLKDDTAFLFRKCSKDIYYYYKVNN